MDKDWFLFEYNREILRKLFMSCSKSEKKLNFPDFQKFCVNSKLIPVIYIQSYISQSQLKTIIARSSGPSSLTKLQIPFEHFEYILKMISQQKASNLSKAEKVKSFFTFLSTTLKVNFILTTTLVKASLNRSNSSYSLKSSQDLNESNSSLDLSIKEALNTLRSHSRKSSSGMKLNLSPQSVGRTSGPGTPRSRSLRRYQDVKPKIASASLAMKVTARLKDKKNPAELDEFLETEKLVQSQYSPLKGDHRPAKQGTRPHDKANDTNKKKVKNCQGFIMSKMMNSFSDRFIAGLIFTAWKSLRPLRLLSNSSNY